MSRDFALAYADFSAVFVPPRERRLRDFSEEGVLLRTNESRQQAGLQALESSPVLMQAAVLKLEDMLAKNYFAHTGPDGTGPLDFVSSAGYVFGCIGENLAEGATELNQLHAAWMSSPGHRRNILSPIYDDVGIAVGSQLPARVVVLFGSHDCR